MRLEHLFDGDLIYDDKGHWVAPFHEGEYMGYAEATGHIAGERISGDVRCLNHPRQLSKAPADFYLPDYHGFISTEDGTTILWRFTGYNIFEPDVPPTYLGRAVMASTFAADDDRYEWMNQTFAIVEAVCTGPLDERDPRTERWQIRAFECVNDLTTA
jgi:hypothetical protein